MSKKLKAFLIYTILFQFLIWSIFGYAVFVMNHSGWWILACAAIASLQFRPRDFGVDIAKDDL